MAFTTSFVVVNAMFWRCGIDINQVLKTFFSNDLKIFMFIYYIYKPLKTIQNKFSFASFQKKKKKKMHVKI
jgi:hypothetical protein